MTAFFTSHRRKSLSFGLYHDVSVNLCPVNAMFQDLNFIYCTARQYQVIGHATTHQPLEFHLSLTNRVTL